MSMKYLIGGVGSLINQEYRQSSKKYGELFTSYHEAYGVIKEEIEEAQAEFDAVYEHFHLFWNSEKNDAVRADKIEVIALKAHLAACELIQVAAMAYKAALGLKGKTEDYTEQEGKS